MLKNKRRLDHGGVGMKFISCFAISFILIFISALISALIVQGLDDPTSKLGLFSLIAMMVSASVSGIISAKISGESGIRFAMLVALAVVLIMLLINVIASAGKVSGGAFMNYACYMGIASLSATLGRKKERHARHRY